MNFPRPIRESYWVVPGRILAGEYPSSVNTARALEKLQRFLDAGVTCFVDLTHPHDPLDPYEILLHRLGANGVKRVPLPIVDMSVPDSAEHAAAILDTIDRESANGGVVYVHCWGGIGRTGTIVGCWLVRHGMTGEEALARVAELWATRPDSSWSTSPQTEAQFDFVRAWAGRDPALVDG